MSANRKERESEREAAMQCLYGLDMTGDDPEAGLKDPMPPETGETEDSSDPKVAAVLESREQSKYLKKTLNLFREHEEQIDDTIRKNLLKWKFERISKVDLAILRLAITEIEYMGTPPKIMINSAVDLAKKYSGDKSFRFINGVLAGYLKARKASR